VTKILCQQKNKNKNINKKQ